MAKHDKPSTKRKQADDDGYASNDDPDDIIDHYAEVGSGTTAATNPGTRVTIDSDAARDGRGRRRPDVTTRDYTAEPEAKTLGSAIDGRHVITEGGDVYAVPDRRRKQEFVEVMENVVYDGLDSLHGND